MEGYLSGERLPPRARQEQHPIHAWRFALQGFLRAHWSMLGPQIKCPAKDMMTNPLPCFGCLDSQVMVCVTKSGTSPRPEERYYNTLKSFKPT